MPIGRYKSFRGPGGGYCRRTDAILVRIPRLHSVVADMLTDAVNVATAYSDAEALLSTCRVHRITLGRENSYKSFPGPGDKYCHRTVAILVRIPRLHSVVDDMLTEAVNVATAYSEAKTLLSTCRVQKITLGRNSSR
jgi:hypothetical protein